MLFLVDYGDDWRFTVKVIGLGQKEANVCCPKVLNQRGDAPDQYDSWNEDEDEREEP